MALLDKVLALQKRPEVLPIERKGAAFVWSPQIEGRPLDWRVGNYANYCAEGYEGNSLIYSAIAYKARVQASVPLRAYKGTREAPELLKESHPLARLVARPNLYQSWAEFQAVNHVYLNTAGNVFIYLDRPKSGGVPQAMYTYRPDRLFIIPGKGGVLGYYYVPEGRSRYDGVPILAQNMIHIRYPDPLDPLEGMGYGLSPLTAMAYSADVDNMVTKFLRAFFKGGAMPSGILKFDVPMQQEAVDRAKVRWKEAHGGYDKWADVMVLDSAGSYQRVGLTSEEMGFMAIDGRNEARILMALGVPPILLGVQLARAIQSNYRESKSQFWHDTMQPELRMFEDELQYYLQGEGGEFVAFDFSGVAELQKSLPETVGAWNILVTQGVPKDVAAAVVGLSLPALPDDGVGYINPMLMPIGAKPAATLAATTPTPKPTMTGGAEAEQQAGQPAKSLHLPLTAEVKAEHYKAVDNIARRWEARYSEAAAKLFQADRLALMGRVTGAREKAVRMKASTDWGALKVAWAAYMDESETKWASTLLELIKGLILDQGVHQAERFGMAFDVDQTRAADWFNRYTLQFAEHSGAVIADTTKADLAALLAQAQTNGWSIPEIQKQLGATFDRYLGGEVRDLSDEERTWFEERKPANRLENIARTETVRASAAGSDALYQEWGIQKREWLATPDGRVRPDHLAANGQVRTFGEPFDIGGYEMDFPGDDSHGAPLESICQCRCAIAPVMGEQGE